MTMITLSCPYNRNILGKCASSPFSIPVSVIQRLKLNLIGIDFVSAFYSTFVNRELMNNNNVGAIYGSDPLPATIMYLIYKLKIRYNDFSMVRNIRFTEKMFYYAREAFSTIEDGELSLKLFQIFYTTLFSFATKWSIGESIERISFLGFYSLLRSHHNIIGYGADIFRTELLIRALHDRQYLQSWLFENNITLFT